MNYLFIVILYTTRISMLGGIEEKLMVSLVDDQPSGSLLAQLNNPADIFFAPY